MANMLVAPGLPLMVNAMKRTLAALLTAAGLAACATAVPEAQLDAAGVERLCVRLAAEPGLLERGSLGHRILNAGASPSVTCRDQAYDAAAASDHYRLVDAYQTVRQVQ